MLHLRVKIIELCFEDKLAMDSVMGWWFQATRKYCETMFYKLQPFNKLNQRQLCGEGIYCMRKFSSEFGAVSCCVKDCTCTSPKT